jgi:hypothetical protein
LLKVEAPQIAGKMVAEVDLLRRQSLEIIAPFGSSHNWRQVRGFEAIHAHHAR